MIHDLSRIHGEGKVGAEGCFIGLDKFLEMDTWINLLNKTAVQGGLFQCITTKFAFSMYIYIYTIYTVVSLF